MDFDTTLRGAIAVASAIRTGLNMLKIILALVSHVGVLVADIEGVVNEVKDAPNGRSALVNGIAALRKLADDIETALAG